MDTFRYLLILLEISLFRCIRKKNTVLIWSSCTRYTWPWFFFSLVHQQTANKHKVQRKVQGASSVEHFIVNLPLSTESDVSTQTSIVQLVDLVSGCVQQSVLTSQKVQWKTKTPTSLHSQNMKHGGSASNVSTSFIKPQLATSGWASLSKGQLTRSPLWAPQSSTGETNH